MSDSLDELEIRFAYHPAETREVRDAHGLVREACLVLARFLRRELPPCREASQALEYVELAMMKANAAIARRGLARPGTPGMTAQEAAEAALAGETMAGRVDDVPTGGKL